MANESMALAALRQELAELQALGPRQAEVDLAAKWERIDQTHGEASRQVIGELRKLGYRTMTRAQKQADTRKFESAQRRSRQKNIHPVEREAHVPGQVDWRYEHLPWQGEGRLEDMVMRRPDPQSPTGYRYLPTEFAWRWADHYESHFPAIQAQMARGGGERASLKELAAARKAEIDLVSRQVARQLMADQELQRELHHMEMQPTGGPGFWRHAPMGELDPAAGLLSAMGREATAVGRGVRENNLYSRAQRWANSIVPPSR